MEQSGKLPSSFGISKCDGRSEDGCREGESSDDSEETHDVVETVERRLKRYLLENANLWKFAMSFEEGIAHFLYAETWMIDAVDGSIWRWVRE